MLKSVKIGLSKLQVEMFIGILADEIENKQSVFIDIECTISELSFNINETFDYRNFELICTKLAKSSKYDLLENYAKDILKELEKYPAIKFVKLKINKPRAIKLAENAYIEIEQAL